MDTEVKKHLKAFAALCSLAMVFSIFSASALASDPELIEIDQAYITDHGNKMPTERGDYILAEDISVSDTAQISEDRAVLSIDLNGHTITYSGSGSVYIVGNVDTTGILAGNVDLTISNGSITTASGYTGGGSADYWISNALCSKPDQGRGGCFLLQNSSSLTLNGVDISNFHVTDEGGAIQVGNGSYLYMNGGSITGCSAKNGGGIAVHTSSRGRSSTINDITYNIVGTARLVGVTISDNTATEGGGGIRALRGDLYMKDCTITDNTCNGSTGGGGIQIANNTNNQQIVEIEGSIQVYGNHSHDAGEEDLFFSDNMKSINLVGDLDASSKICFRKNYLNTTDKYFIVGEYNYDLGTFICTSDEYEPILKNNAIMLKKLALPKITGCNVAISGSILLNAQLNLGSYDDDNTSVTYAYSYTKYGQTKNIEKTLGRTELTSSGSNYILTIPVESACMTAPIEIAIHYGTSGKTVSETFTIENYAKAIMDGNYTQAQKEAAEALIIYGGYAQVQLGINTEMLPTVEGVDFSSSFADSIPAQAYEADEAFYGASLSLLSETNLKLYFKKSAFEGESAPTMTVSYGSGSETISGTPNGGYYMYTIKGPSGTGFSAAQYDSEFSYSVGDVSGNYSIYTYLKVAKNGGSDALKNLAEAYYNFALKCKAVA